MMPAMSEMTAGRAIPQLTLGWRLKMALGDYGATEIAADLGVDRSTVSRWMADRGAPPKVAYIKQWALITHTDPEWLQTGETPRSSDGPGGNDGKGCAIRDSNPEPADSVGESARPLALVRYNSRAA